MAHKDIDILLDERADGASDGTPDFDEFDRAVTTRISLDLARALEGDVTDDPAVVQVIDAQIAAHVEPATDDTLDTGFLLKDRFEIIELVHSSAMGHVYKAVDHRRHPEGAREVHVAIKMMRRAIASQREAGLALEREAAKAQSLSHPNIINIFDFDQHDGQFFLVMEWLEGESVNALLRRTSGHGVPPSLAWKVIGCAATALQHAHSNNVVHADINPSNIFVTDSGDVKLLDFGVARYIGDSVNADDGQFAWVTRTYASPQVLSGITPDFEDDVFALGCVAYRLLCGRHPFDGVPSLVAKHKGVAVQRADGLTDNDWRILSLTLAYERTDRPNDVAVFLGNGASDKQAVAVRQPDTIDSRALAVHWPDIHYPLEPGERWYDSARRIGIVAAVAIALLAGAGWLLQRDNGLGDMSSVENSALRATSTDTDAPSAADALVAVATQAIDAGEFVTATGDDARTLFRYAVAMDPNNAAALRGLRTISDTYVQQANDALRSGDIAGAYAAIDIATETDAGNPSIAITNRLIVAQGDREIADARLAAAAGDAETAAAQLANAEKFAHLDPASIDLVRQQVSQIDGDSQFLSGLATADAYITAGKLMPPGLDNAYAILTRLQQTHGDDARLIGPMERLGERLLTRAAFATAATKFDAATDFVDAVENLGILPLDVEFARVTLSASEEAFNAKAAEETAETLNVAAALVATNEVETAAATSGPTLLVAASETEAGVDGASATSQNATPTGPASPRAINIEDKGLTRYVAPVYPRRALQRGITGHVDIEFSITPDGKTDEISVVDAAPSKVFDSSAVKAVRKWRFEARDNPDRAKITLRFELPP